MPSCVCALSGGLGAGGGEQVCRGGQTGRAARMLWGVHARGGSLTFFLPRPRLGRPRGGKPASVLTPPGPSWDLMAGQSLWTRVCSSEANTKEILGECLAGRHALSPRCRARDLLTRCVLGGNRGLGSNVGNQEGYRRPSPLWVFRETWGPMEALHRKFSKQEQTEAYEGVKSSTLGKLLEESVRAGSGRKGRKPAGGEGWRLGVGGISGHPTIL